MCVTVTDTKNVSASKCIDITVSNRNPVISSLTVSNDDPDVGETITATVTATDPDGDTLGYGWSYGIGNNARDQNYKFTGSGVTVSYTLSVAGTFTITVTVTDGDGGVATASVSLSPTDTDGTHIFTGSYFSSTYTADEWLFNVTVGDSISITCTKVSGPNDEVAQLLNQSGGGTHVVQASPGDPVTVAVTATVSPFYLLIGNDQVASELPAIAICRTSAQ